jgi:very-short-patch-repair endonuclease/RecA/RadA recombinase
MYGWPTIVVTDRDHTPKVAPLFAVQIEPEQGPDNQWELHATMEPEFNLAITASGIFDPSITEDISDLLSHGLPFGDADAFGVLAGRTADLLGLPILSPLNASILESNIDRKQGIYNAAISVVAEWSGGYTSTLREELRRLQTREDWATTAAAHLLLDGFAQQEDKRPPSEPLAAPLVCNQSQEETLERLRRDPLTVVTGPPGTGKTQLVVNAVANAWLDGDKILVTSTNNGAVDVAVERAEKDVIGGLLVRTGNRDVREQVPDRITAASAQAAAHRGNQAAARAQLKRVATERTQLMEKLARLDELDVKLLQVVEGQEELRQALKEAARTLWTNASPPELSISSHEIEQRARGLLRTWLFPRFRARRFRRRLGCLKTASLDQLVIWAQIDQRIAKLTSQLEIGRAKRQQLKSAVGDPTTRVREADQKWADASLYAIRVDTATRISSGANRLALFGTIPVSSDRFRRVISNSFRYVRGWACTALTAHSNFPLESGLFDLVIVDEASQCSLAAVLPLAYRAKRLAVVGDPYQLNPIVSLSDGLLQEIATQAGFDNDALRDRGIHYKDGSAYAAFEFVARPQTPVLLNEHYRCHPHIARWFNKTFYKGELTVLTDVSDVSQRDRAIYWCDIDGAAVRPATGSWLNRAEAEETVKQLRGAIESGYKTVGVVTPFTAQARLIGQIAKTQFGQDFLDDIDFVSGTAHRLQGDERDAVILSSVLSPGMSKSGARWIEKERNLLNVAVSRARRALIVLGHPLMGDLGSPTLASLRVYLRDEVARNEGTGSPFAEFRTDSTSEKILLDAMQLQDLLPYGKLEVEGYELDFALLEQGIKLNIEVDGDQHLDARSQQRRQDITRDRVLVNLGWTILRIPAWRCHEEIDSVIEEIRKTQDRLLDEASRRTF